TAAGSTAAATGSAPTAAGSATATTGSTTTAGSALLGGPRRHHARVRARRHVAGARAVTAALATLPGSAGTLTLLATALLTGLAALATLSGTTGALATLLTATGTRRGRTRGRRTGSHAERVVA